MTNRKKYDNLIIKEAVFFVRSARLHLETAMIEAVLGFPLESRFGFICYV